MFRSPVVVELPNRRQALCRYEGGRYESKLE